MTMKIVFAGTPEFAAVALKAIHEAGFEIPLVLTQPDRPAGRGMQLQASSVKQYALAHGIEVLQPLSLRMDAKDPQRAQEAQAAHERLALATEASALGVFDWDLATDALRWDAATRAVFGLPSDAPVDIDVFYALLHPDDRDRVGAIVGGALDPVLVMSPPGVGHPWLDHHRGDVVVEGAGHWVQQDSAAAVNTALLDFLSGLDLGLDHDLRS